MGKISLMSLLVFSVIWISGAQTNSEEINTEKNWKFEITPYAWIGGFRAETDFRQGLSTQVNADFSDIREKLELTGSLHAEASKGRFILVGDLLYFKSDKAGLLYTEQTPTRLYIDQWVAELAVAYNFVNNQDAFFVDGLAGWRSFNIDSRLTIDGEEEFDRTLVSNDFFIGARLRISSDNWTFLLRGDLGGFGWGSNLSLRIDALGSYEFSELFSLNFGLQAVSIDYRKDTYGLELLTTGLTFGGQFTF